MLKIQKHQKISDHCVWRRGGKRAQCIGCIVRKLSKGYQMEVYSENQTCPAVGYQAATVCVPVTVEPFAKAGMTKTKCCGNRTSARRAGLRRS